MFNIYVTDSDTAFCTARNFDTMWVFFFFRKLVDLNSVFNPYPTAFQYGNGMVLHFYQQQESSTTKTVHKVINKGLKAYV